MAIDSQLRFSVEAGQPVPSSQSAAGSMAAGVGTIYRRSANGAIDEVVIAGSAPAGMVSGPSNAASGTPWPEPASGTLASNVLVRNAFVALTGANALSVATRGNVTLENALLAARDVTLTAHSLTLRGGSRVTASGLGTSAPNFAANTTLGATGQVFGAGGGHAAGYGIKSSTTARVADHTTAVPYPDPVPGNIKQPASSGLIGGAARPADNLPVKEEMLGGNPGGKVRLVLKGALTLEDAASRVEADGGKPQISTEVACAAQGTYVPGCAVRMPYVALVGGGGGGAGSVWIDCVDVVGMGSISAAGGDVVNVGELNGMPVDSPGGPGGGGWVALYYKSIADSVSVSARGGRSAIYAYGTPGFKYLKNTETFAEDLVIDNENNAQQNSWPATTLPNGQYAKITIKGGGNVRAQVNLNVALLTLSEKGQLRSLTDDGALNIRADEVKVLDGARIKAATLQIHALTVDVNGAELNAEGVSAGGAVDGATVATEGGGGGGSPATSGGACGTVLGGEPNTPASGALTRGGKGGDTGGAGSMYALVSGGRGGGAIRLNVYDQLKLDDALVTVSGDPGASTENTMLGSGGGGGGMIEIITNSIAGTGGRLLAVGGNAQATGGAGSGGLVRIVSGKKEEVEASCRFCCSLEEEKEENQN